MVSVLKGENLFQIQLKTLVKTNVKLFMLWKSMVPRSLPSASLLKNFLLFSSPLHLQQHLLSSLLAYKASPSSPLPIPLLKEPRQVAPIKELKTDGWSQGFRVPKDRQPIKNLAQTLVKGNQEV